MSEPKLKRILRRAQVSEATGLPTSTLYEQIAAGTFPKPVPLGPHTVGWLEDEIAEWQAQRIAKREAETGSAT